LKTDIRAAFAEADVFEAIPPRAAISVTKLRLICRCVPKTAFTIALAQLVADWRISINSGSVRRVSSAPDQVEWAKRREAEAWKNL
jgi:hypothetical protein